jgi:hypothetical protein
MKVLPGCPVVHTQQSVRPFVQSDHIGDLPAPTQQWVTSVVEPTHSLGASSRLTLRKDLF